MLELAYYIVIIHERCSGSICNCQCMVKRLANPATRFLERDGYWESRKHRLLSSCFEEWIAEAFIRQSLNRYLSFSILEENIIRD